MFRVVVLIDDNNGATGLKSEQGFSVLIETEKDGNFVFDFGASGAFRDNATRMGINLSVVRTGILSHGHCGHSGGLKEFFMVNMFSKVYARPNVFSERFSEKTGGYTGVSFDVKEHYTDRFVFENSVKEIGENVFFMGEIPRQTDFLLYGGSEDKRYEDESAVVLKSRSGLTVLVGCCYMDLYSTVKYVSKTFVDTPINAVIGGFSLNDGSTNGFEAVKKVMDEFSVNFFAAGHCTGVNGLERLSSLTGNKLLTLYSGAVLFID